MSSVHLLNQPVVLDLGSGLTKGGYAGTPDPSVILGTLSGRTRLPKVLPTSSGGDTTNTSSFSTSGLSASRLVTDDVSPVVTTSASSSATATSNGAGGGGNNVSKSSRSSYVVGRDLLRMSGILTIDHPIRHGIVHDWNGAEAIWRHICHDLLMVTPGEHPYLVTEAALNPRPNRERLAQFFFEGLGAPALHIAFPAPLSLFACGRTSGLVLDVGDSVTTAVPVAEGHCDVHALQRSDFAGRDVTDRMLTLLRKSGSSLFATSSEWQAVRRMKEKLGYVATNPASEELRMAQISTNVRSNGNGKEYDERNGNDNSNSNSKQPTPTSFQLPDGNVIRVAAERFRAPEILFQPDIVGREFGGVHNTIATAINHVDIGLRRNMYSNILLAGGSTKFKGFGKRLLEEMKLLAPQDTKVKIIAPPDRLTAAFTGGTILASLSTTFRSVAVTRQEYFEKGSAIVHGKTL